MIHQIRQVSRISPCTSLSFKISSTCQRVTACLTWDHFWPLLEMGSTLYSLLLVLVLLVITDAHGLDSCVPQIKVQQNSFQKVTSKSQLKISCPVTYCQEIPSVEWYRISDRVEFLPLDETDQITITQEKSGSVAKKVISHLTFKNISEYDTGMYKCKVREFNFSLEGHIIHVNVSDRLADSMITYGTNRLEQTTDALSTEWLPYVFICFGILGLVTGAMLISFLSIYGCRCSKVQQQHVASFTSPSLNLWQSDRRGGCQTTLHQPRKIHHAPTGMEELVISSLYSDVRESRSQQIVYATLEHLPPRSCSGPLHPPKKQFSEYAEIQIP